MPKLQNGGDSSLRIPGESGYDVLGLKQTVSRFCVRKFAAFGGRMLCCPVHLMNLIQYDLETLKMKKRIYDRFLTLGLVCLLASVTWAQDSVSTDDSKENKKNTVTQYRFAEPVKLETSDGKPIDVTVGHSAPLVYDFDKDGVKDLLVGEFGDGTFEGETTAMKPDDYCNARIRIYRNSGTDSKPVYKDFEYLKAGGKIASVPNT